MMTRSSGFGEAKSGLLKVLSGTFIAQLITLLFLPVITRVYTPEDFGALTFIASTAMLVSTFATMRLDTAMMLPEKTSEVRALLCLSMISIGVVSIAAGVAVAFIIVSQPTLATIPFIPFWVVATVILTSLFTVLNRLALRKTGYGEVGKRAVAQALGTGSGQTLLSFYPAGGTGLVLGSLIGRCVGLIPLYRFTREFFGFPERGLSRKMLRKYWRFPVVFAPSSALNAFGVQAPLLFVSAWFGVAYAGVLGVADRIIGVPMTLVGNAVGSVFDAEMAKMIRAGRRDFLTLYFKVSAGLGVIALGVGLTFFFFGEWLVPIALGSEWELAGTCVKVMSLTIALRLIASPTARVIGLFQRSRGMLMIDLTRMLLTVASIGFVVFTAASFIQAVVYLYSALSLVYIITWLYGWYIVGQEAHRQ